MARGIENELLRQRERLGWTQERAGEAAGITRQSYAAIESGTSVPSTEVALRLARAMGRSVEELFRLPDAPAAEATALWAGGESAVGQRVRLVRVAGELVAHVAGEGERPSGPADGVVVGWAGDAGHVRVALLQDRPPTPEVAVVGCDPAFGIVSESLRRERGVEVVWSSRGSRTALQALASGRAHVAGAHLHDPETGVSNEPWIREIVSFPCTRIRFADWEEGILVRAGNPAGMTGADDLARPDVRLVNREPGSGSRLLLDQTLESLGVAGEAIDGYETEARGHLAVGEAVASGLADAGIGIRAAGAVYGLDVLPLRTEAYELIVPDHFLDLPAVRALLDTLRRPGIRGQVEALQGYDGSGMGEPV